MNYQRFTEKGRRVIFYARDQAIKRYQPNVSVEYIVFAVLCEEQPVLVDCYGIARPDVLIGEVRTLLPSSESGRVVNLLLSPEAKQGIEEAIKKAEIHVTPWFLLWILYPSINPQVVSILETHGITRDSLREKKLV
jgi:ATP-dependent Clp protease ATP-binding subunit ClpC